MQLAWCRRPTTGRRGAAALARLISHQPRSGIDSSGSSSSDSGWQRWAAAACGAAAGLAAGAAAMQLAPVAQGEASTLPHLPEDVRRSRFQSWMRANGADWSAVDVQPCLDPDAGLGLFATRAIRQHMTHRWLGRRLGAALLRGETHQAVPVAAVPLELALTAVAARRDPDLGGAYGELLDLGVAGERDVVALMLLVERLRGPASRLSPYLQLLPESFTTPLWFTQEQMRELAGTTLAAATAARQAAIARSWERLRPAARDMLRQVGVLDEPTLEDFTWATSVFWSRALALPVPIRELQPQGEEEGGGGGVERLRLEVHEGLVPGLDFANHSQEARCWWEVVEGRHKHRQLQRLRELQQQEAGEQLLVGEAADELEAAAGAEGDAGEGPQTQGHVVQIVANRACCPAAGDELSISYGDKGNEELMMLYGFALPDNPHETLMLLCPLPPPEEWDAGFAARMQLLQAKGLRPQLFLSAAHLENCREAAAAGRGRSGARACSVLPAAAREVLEVFAMQPAELQEQLRALGAGAAPAAPAGADNGGGGGEGEGEVGPGPPDAVQRRIESLGMSMAVLTTLVRLLELKMVKLEGDEEGTGPLEDDVRRLEEAGALTRCGVGAGAAAQVPAWLRGVLLYRAGQKALVRTYLTAARAELQDTLVELQALMEVTGEPGGS